MSTTPFVAVCGLTDKQAEKITALLEGGGFVVIPAYMLELKRRLDLTLEEAKIPDDLRTALSAAHVHRVGSLIRMPENRYFEIIRQVAIREIPDKKRINFDVIDLQNRYHRETVQALASLGLSRESYIEGWEPPK